jgi:hypothetical protein
MTLTAFKLEKSEQLVRLFRRTKIQADEFGILALTDFTRLKRKDQKSNQLFIEQRRWFAREYSETDFSMLVT